LSHEMGHAAQKLDGWRVPGRGEEEYLLELEQNNVDTYERVIARELGEPGRTRYLDSLREYTTGCPTCWGRLADIEYCKRIGAARVSP
jgi:hypothetical protein